MNPSDHRGSLTPRDTVAELDRYVIGQAEAKRSVAIALRNRWRRQQVEPPLREEIAPKNIIMIGPTGVGKTEIARRLAHLAQSPFLKIEASKFTEVGYVGRDVESMIRDLVQLAITMVTREEAEGVEGRAEANAEERLLDLLLPRSPAQTTTPAKPAAIELGYDGAARQADYQGQTTRERFREMLRRGELDDRTVELAVSAQGGAPTVEMFSASSMEEMQSSLQDAFSKFFPKKKQPRRMKVPEALDYLRREEAERLVDHESVTEKAIRRTEQSGIIFLDEIDKIASRGGAGSGAPEVSREGVQRDLLPIVEGTTVTTKYGPVKTDHILFIASGAFHLAKPSDLIPEMQGRFPIRVELGALSKDDFVRILTEPKAALTRQYVELLKTEGVALTFADDAVDRLAAIAAQVNERQENIGARRLHTVLERLLDTLSYEAPDKGGSVVTIDRAYLDAHLGELVQDPDLSRYIL